MAAPIYRFQIRFGDPEETHEVFPVWKDDLAIEWATESGQRFLRSGLSGTIDLIREDYALVMSQAFGVVYHLDILKSNDNGVTWGVYWQGHFAMTDCTVDVDDERLTVKPQVTDDYTDILTGWEKEYDLIKLLPEVQKIKVVKRPMIQIYSEGANYINCFIGSTYFEQDVNTPSTDDIQGFLKDECHFKVLSDLVEINFENPPSGFGEPFTGYLINGNYLTNTIGTYRLKYYEVTYTVSQTEVFENGLQVVPAASDTVLWQFSQQNAVTGYKPIPITMEFEPQNGSSGTLVADRSTRYVYGRVLCNTPSRTGYETYPIMDDDIMPYNRNYHYCFPFNGSYRIYTDVTYFGYTGKSSDPTQWGMDDNGQYFTAPGPGAFPIGCTNWVNTSDWYMPGYAANAIDEDFRHEYTLNDAYPIWSCIKVLLGQIAPDITFDGTEAYSYFMYHREETVTPGVYVYEDPIGHRDCRLFITPKSNITAGEYQTPAQTAPVTLKTLLDMMANTFCLHWFIESVDVGGGTIEKRLRIEHVKYFRNGGTYSGTRQIGIDMTDIYNTRNGKPWSFCTSEYNWEKTDMPERYQFGWMDEVTDPFKGNPIEVLSPFVQKGKIENVDVAQFTSDIDMMLLNPSAFSPDGFAVMTIDVNGALPMVQYSTTVYGGEIQNGLLAYVKLQQPYWMYEMPAKSLRIGNTEVTAQGVSRHKAQAVSVPYGDGEPQLRKLVRTGIGDGEIRSLSLRLTSRMAKVQLRYDTEE